MAVKKYALIKLGVITNIVLWDSADAFDPANVEARVSLEFIPNAKIGDEIEDLISVSPTHNVVVDGNSLSNGFGLTHDGAVYTAFLEVSDAQWSYLNQSINGRTTTQMIPAGATIVDAHYNAGLGAGKNFLMVWEGINDINSGLTDVQAYNNLKTYCEDRKLVGWLVILATLTPATRFDATEEAYRISVNQMIRDAFANEEPWLDAIADVGSDAEIGLPGSHLDTTYYSVDELHLNDYGHLRAATYFKTALLSVSQL